MIGSYLKHSHGPLRRNTKEGTEQDTALRENYLKRYLSIDCPRKILTSCQPYRPTVSAWAPRR